jgi:TonB-linked SusC/RagA family outer membrane protein
MKNSVINYDLFSLISKRRKLLLIMKITVFLLFCGLINLVAAPGYSQKTKISLDMEDASIESVLNYIEEISEFYFLFNHQLIDVERKVDIVASKKTIKDILNEIFQDDVRFIVSGRQIVLSPAEESFALEERLQQQTLSGKVIDASTGEPLPGVNIIVKGTNIGTISDIDGMYSLSETERNDTLVFSYVGYTSQEIPLNGRTILDVALQSEMLGLEEVVVVGYGTQKKVNITGSVDVVPTERIINRSAPNMSFLLQGTSPNLLIRISDLGGEPGASGIWNIRGMGSISGNDSPLILVDGVEMDINRVNPESVENVSILKDASASAIYGSRAPFGVVLITTKRGTKGLGTRIEYSNNLAVKHPMNLPHCEESLNWAIAYNQACENAGKNPQFPDEQIERIKGYLNGTFLYEYNPDDPISNLWGGRRYGNANYDWPHELTKDLVFTQKHDLSISGGDEKTIYYISGGFLDEPGIYNYGYDYYHRFNTLVNLTSQVTDWLNFDFSTRYALTKTDQFEGQTSSSRERIWREAMYFGPLMPKYNVNGTIQCPLIRLLQDAGRNKEEINDFWVNLGAELEPVKGWKTKVTFNYNKISTRFSADPKPVYVELGDGSEGNIGRPYTAFITTTSSSPYLMFNALTSYEKTLGNHYFKVLVGYEQDEKEFNDLYGRRDQLITVEVPSISTAIGAITVNDEMYHWATQGIFGRLNYNFKEKYLVEFSARYNGSSRFAPEQRWGFFPSASVGYKISEEIFWEKIRPFVNRLKLRVSYGSLGNQNVANYTYLSRIPVNSQLNWIINNELPPYALVPDLISEDLTWETITTFDLGIDAGFLNNRLDFVFDWYERTTTDMIGPSVTLPSVLGAPAPRSNNAELVTKGFEIILGWKGRVSSNFSYNAQISLGDNKTTVLKYTNDKGLIDTWYEGKEVGEIWGFVTDGIIQTEAEVAEMPDQSKYYKIWRPGDMKYQDLNGDGIINDGSRTLDDYGDLSVIGNMSPRYNIGITAGFHWKGFDFSMFWQGVGKRDYYPGLTSTIFWGMRHSFGNSALNKDTQHLDYWRPAGETNMFGPNTDAYFAKPYLSRETEKNRQTQTRYLLNAAYLRFKNFQIGYTVPARLSNKVFIREARIYISGENLLTIKKLPKILDPETAIASEPSQGGYIASGVIYPLSTMLSIGCNLTF